MAYQVEHNAQVTPPHHRFSLLKMLRTWVYLEEYYPWVYCTR